MASKPTIQFFPKGFEGILCDPGVMAEVREQTEKICYRANTNGDAGKGMGGFNAGTRIGTAFRSKRALGFVYSTDEESSKAESEHKVLSRAVSG
ncbi:MAG: hypothetical protein IKF90_16060 [Parasporobacterium sp.]|nr:hypothetical protein [Parasporobacterium sp.]